MKDPLFLDLVVPAVCAVVFLGWAYIPLILDTLGFCCGRSTLDSPAVPWNPTAKHAALPDTQRQLAFLRFEPVGSYVTHIIFYSAWFHWAFRSWAFASAPERCYACVTRTNERDVYVGFVTALEDGGIIVTGNLPNGQHFNGVEGNWIEVEASNPEQLLEQHKKRLHELLTLRKTLVEDIPLQEMVRRDDRICEARRRLRTGRFQEWRQMLVGTLALPLFFVVFVGSSHPFTVCTFPAAGFLYALSYWNILKHSSWRLR